MHNIPKGGLHHRPAMSRDDDPAALKWINDQAQKGATVIGFRRRQGVGAAGLLDHKRATTHWFSVKALRNEHPSVSTSLIGGLWSTGRLRPPRASALDANDADSDRGYRRPRQGGSGRPRPRLARMDARHDSSAFSLTPLRHDGTGQHSRLLEPDQLGIELTPGMDEISLALVADAWSRTYRSTP